MNGMISDNGSLKIGLPYPLRTIRAHLYVGGAHIDKSGAGTGRSLRAGRVPPAGLRRRQYPIGNTAQFAVPDRTQYISIITSPYKGVM